MSLIHSIWLAFFGCAACNILTPWPGIELMPLPVETWMLSHWTTRKFPMVILKKKSRLPYLCLFIRILVQLESAQSFSHVWLCNPGTVACLCPWNSPKRILEWVAILVCRGIFPTQGSNPGLLHRRQTLPSEPPGKSTRKRDMKQEMNLLQCSCLENYMAWRTWWANQGGCKKARQDVGTEPTHRQCIIFSFYCCVKQRSVSKFKQKKCWHLHMNPPLGFAVFISCWEFLAVSCTPQASISWAVGSVSSDRYQHFPTGVKTGEGRMVH